MDLLTEERTNQDLRYIGEILKTGDSLLVKNPEAGDIYIDKGHVGKSGNGLQHIIEQRFEKDKRTADEITAMLGLVMSAVENGKVTRNIEILHNAKDIGTLDIERNGIIAFVSKTRDGRDEKFVITGFDDFTKKEEAAGAIKAVIADNGYAPEFVIVKKQVVATLASAYILHLKELKVNLEKKNILVAKKYLEKIKPYLASNELNIFFSKEKPRARLKEIAGSIGITLNRLKNIPEFSEICTRTEAVVSSYSMHEQGKVGFGKNIVDDRDGRR